ncbi:unnamed protein product [Rotaria sp. Silwood2]|nr:unnamed protein product [Rotaria sp. Silwood2]
MDVNKTSSTTSLENRYAEIARKTTEAIAAEELPLFGNKRLSIQRSLPELPRYQPPLPSPPSMERYRMCRMFFPTSGHMGFETVKLSDELPPIEIVREMVLYETRLRLSDSIQKIMDEYHTDECAVTYVHDLIQHHVVDYFGYRDVNALRTALHRFPDDPIVQTAFYAESSTPVIRKASGLSSLIQSFSGTDSDDEDTEFQSMIDTTVIKKSPIRTPVKQDNVSTNLTKSTNKNVDDDNKSNKSKDKKSTRDRSPLSSSLSHDHKNKKHHHHKKHRHRSSSSSSSNSSQSRSQKKKKSSNHDQYSEYTKSKKYDDRRRKR